MGCLLFRFAYTSRELSPNTFVYLSESTIAFPVGRHLWKYNIKKKEMSFLARRTHPVEPFLRVSGNRRRLLMAETVEGGKKKAFLQLIDLSHKVPTVMWKFNHLQKGILTSADISPDGEVVAAHLSYLEEESKTACSFITLWKTDTRKYIASKELSTPIKHITIHPEDNYLICVTGVGYVRYLKCVGNTMDEVPLLRRHNERHFTFMQQAWLSLDTMASLTEQGVVCVFVKGELKQKITPEGTGDDRPVPVSIVHYRDGFILGTETGGLAFYQSSQNGPYDPLISRLDLVSVRRPRKSCWSS